MLLAAGIVGTAFGQRLIFASLSKRGVLAAAFVPRRIGLLHAWTGLLAIGAGLVWSGAGAGRSILVAVEIPPSPEPVSRPARSA